MPTLETQGITLYYETFGEPSKPPLMLLAGLGGTGASWSGQTARFAKSYFVVVPDHRGTGRSTDSQTGYSTTQLAADMSSLVKDLSLGATHIIGASTGGAIGQMMALNHPDMVKTLTLVSSFARFDGFMRRQFELRHRLVAESGGREVYEAYSLFLFAPRFAREHPESVEAWIERAAAQPVTPEDRKISLQRIDMIAAHDALPRLAEIRQPCLAVCGDLDFCTPLPLSEEIAGAIP